MLTGIGLATSFQFTDVEAVVEDVRKFRAMKSRLALAIDMPFSLKLIAQTLEGQTTTGINIEDANHGLRFLRMRLHRLVAIVGHVDVAIGSKTSRPALPNPLVHPFEDFGPARGFLSVPSASPSVAEVVSTTCLY